MHKRHRGIHKQRQVSQVQKRRREWRRSRMFKEKFLSNNDGSGISWTQQIYASNYKNKRKERRFVENGKEKIIV